MRNHLALWLYKTAIRLNPSIAIAIETYATQKAATLLTTILHQQQAQELQGWQAHVAARAQRQ